MKIGIAGAGLLGRLCAWRLLRAGCQVSLFEAGSLNDCPGAAATAAGMISPLSELVDSERLIYDMGMAGLSIWPRWNSELTQPVHYAQEGSIVVAHSQDTSQLTQFESRLKHHLQDNEQQACRWLDQHQLGELESDLSAFPRALYLQSEAHIDNFGLLLQLLQEIEQLGGNCFEHTPARRVEARVIETDDQTFNFDWVLDCRGVGAKPDTDDLRGVRGETLRVHTDEIQLQRPVRFMHPKYKIYVVPKANQRFIIGATEIESEDLSPISLRSTLELSSALYALNPAFAEARVLATKVNLRPTLIDNRPHVDYCPGLLRANGLYRHGYLLAPVMVDNIVNLVLDRSPSVFAADINRKHLHVES